jgi:hypothetical protein
MRKRRDGLFVFVRGLVSWLALALAVSPGAKGGDERPEVRSEAQPQAWVVDYRFVGDPEERVYQEFEETGPGGEEAPCLGEVILVRVIRVIAGQPDVDENGMFRYRSLYATTEVWPLPLGPYWPWRHLEYEFTGLRRTDPSTGQALVKTEVRPLLGRWIVSALLVVGLIVADAVLLVLLAVRLLRRLGHSRV